MKLISKNHFNETFEIEVNEQELLNAIESKSDLGNLEFIRKRRGTAYFVEGNNEFGVVYDESLFDYKERPLNSLVELFDEEFEVVESFYKELRNGDFD